jgi:subtilisin
MKKKIRKSFIITFKAKDKRPDKDKDKDKINIVSAAMTQPITPVDAAQVQPGAAATRGVPPEQVVYDVNEYEAPLVIAQLTDQEVETLRKDQNVKEIEEDGLCYALGEFEDVGHLLFENQPAPQAETVPAGVSRIKASLAWDATRGKGIKVAVLDTGIDFDHPDLAPNYRGGVSFVPDEASAKDFNSHGTHCAGTIAAAINGRGVVGVAPAAYLYAVKVLSRTGSGAWSSLISGLEWCIANGIHIANLSLGASTAPNAVRHICDLAAQRGVLLVAAAGNTGGPVGAPAHFDSVIAVSAIDSNNMLAGFSDHGPEIELCAPGVDVLSTLPGGRHGRLSGTSMAFPHVAGAAALAWSTHRYAPEGLANNVVIRRLLAWTADSMGIPGRSEQFGFGCVDAERAAFELTPPPAIPGLP